MLLLKYDSIRGLLTSDTIHLLTTLYYSQNSDRGSLGKERNESLLNVGQFLSFED